MAAKANYGGKMAAPQKWFFTDEEDEILIRAFLNPEKKKGTMKATAKRLMKPYKLCMKRLRNLGYVTSAYSYRKKWSNEEIDILERFSHLSNENVQIQMRKQGYSRSISSIINKRQRERILIYEERSAKGIYSANELSFFFNVAIITIIRWINKGWLKATRSDLRKGTKVPFNIERKDIRHFIIRHIDDISLGRVRKQWFVDILTTRNWNDGVTLATEEESEEEYIDEFPNFDAGYDGEFINEGY